MSRDEKQIYKGDGRKEYKRNWTFLNEKIKLEWIKPKSLPTEYTVIPCMQYWQKSSFQENH